MQMLFSEIADYFGGSKADIVAALLGLLESEFLIFKKNDLYQVINSSISSSTLTFLVTIKALLNPKAPLPFYMLSFRRDINDFELLAGRRRDSSDLKGCFQQSCHQDFDNLKDLQPQTSRLQPLILSFQSADLQCFVSGNLQFLDAMISEMQVATFDGAGEMEQGKMKLKWGFEGGGGATPI
ncbi:hypothetical protein KSP40_PGU009564 [Platanthera guangdongensis]|uniref:Uncharacterized protein n=1 Tax=Platanthera guangdongensis TaxID=2320717 RepID=A0ABR2MBU8_9ASPA